MRAEDSCFNDSDHVIHLTADCDIEIKNGCPKECLFKRNICDDLFNQSYFSLVVTKIECFCSRAMTLYYYLF